MRNLIRYTGLAATILVATPMLILGGDVPAPAADHFDPPARVQVGTAAVPDIPADMADLYVFSTPTSVVFSMDFGGPQPANNSAVYDRNVSYMMMISNAGAATDAEVTIEFRFGQDPANPAASGIRITGLPGNGPIVVPCETIFTTPNGIKVMAGLFDDPFNFDAQGLTETRQTGRLSIRSDRNRFTGMNSTGVIFEIPKPLIVNGTNPIAVWATSSRFPGTTP